MENQNVGIIGLGLIGSEWAKHLDTDGVLAATWNRTLKPEFAKHVADLETLASKASILHICVYDEPALLQVLNTLKPYLSSEHFVIQSTTIGPEGSEQCKTLVESCGASYLEAPFTGSLPAAQARKTIFLPGGEEKTLARGLAYLKRLSEKQVVFANNRQACTFKLSMNLQLAVAMQAIAQSVSLCRKEGISDDLFFEGFKANASYAPVAAMKEPLIRSGDFTPQFSIKNLAKDITLYAKMRQGADAGLEKNVLEHLQRGIDNGFGDEDFSAIVKTV